MKHLIITTLICLPLMGFAADPGTVNTINNQDESGKISLYIPGFMMQAGSWFVKKENDPELKSLLKRLRSTSIVIREGNAYKNYNASGKFDRKIHKLDSQHFEEILTVFDDGEKFSILVRQNKKEKIRQLVLVADDGDKQFVFLRLRCNISIDDLKNLLNKENLSKEKLNDIIKA